MTDARDFVRATRPFIYEKANVVLGHIKPDENGVKQIDPFTIIAIISTLVKLWKCWKDTKKAVENCNEPSLVNRVQLRRLVKQGLGRDKYRKYGDDVINGLLALGRTATEEDIKRLIEEERQNSNG